ncbi:DUF3450 family protein [Pontiella agarivorans]|uniref:DUF3450 family protein n=1 Tax=Pontiella agarivorans TaxID=3038953 RepID=A0ABU5MVJ4_9BACT|nr:DUF3450 family protein [Pontiella agarivorans]MDZ8118142.1 DUF3450 family protein [Pontiella agarivorans]
MSRYSVIILWALITGVNAEEVPLHKQVETHLAEANRLRSVKDAEYQAWQENRAKMETLLAGLESVARQTEAAAEADRQQAAQYKAASAELRRNQETGAMVQQACMDLMSDIHKTLDEIAAASIPGTVPAREKAYGELKEQWQQTMSRWKAVEDAMQRIEVRVTVGLLNNEAVKVKALLVGTSLGWWLDQNTGRAGFLVPPTHEGEAVELIEFPMSGTAQAELRKAFQIIEGRRAPHWIYLPFQGVEK